MSDFGDHDPPMPESAMKVIRLMAQQVLDRDAEIKQLQADNVRMANVLAHPIMQACLGLNPQITSGGLSTNPTNQGAK